MPCRPCVRPIAGDSAGQPAVKTTGVEPKCRSAAPRFTLDTTVCPETCAGRAVASNWAIPQRSNGAGVAANARSPVRAARCAARRRPLSQVTEIRCARTLGGFPWIQPDGDVSEVVVRLSCCRFGHRHLCCELIGLSTEVLCQRGRYRAQRTDGHRRPAQLAAVPHQRAQPTAARRSGVGRQRRPRPGRRDKPAVPDIVDQRTMAARRVHRAPQQEPGRR